MRPTRGFLISCEPKPRPASGRGRECHAKGSASGEVAPWRLALSGVFPSGFAGLRALESSRICRYNISPRFLCTPQPCKMSPPIAPPHHVLPAPAHPPHRRPRWDGRRVLRGDVGVCHRLSRTESPASTSYCTVPVTSSIVFLERGGEKYGTHSTVLYFRGLSDSIGQSGFAPRVRRAASRLHLSCIGFPVWWNHG